MAHSFDQNFDTGNFQTLAVDGIVQPHAENKISSNGTAKRKSKTNSKTNRSSYSNNGSGGAGEERFDSRFKVILLGNSGVGKTSVLRTLMGERFHPGTISTIGIDLAKKIFNVDGNRILLEIWDTAGQEQYQSIVAFHFRGAKAFIVMYDVTQTNTFEQIRKYWLRSVDDHMDEPVPVFFAANKVDLDSTRVITSQDGEKLASQQCAHGYFETSAKTGLNVVELFQKVAEAMVSTWGAPKRWYEAQQNGDSTGNWPNQAPGRQVVNLSLGEVKPPKSSCCIVK